MTRNDSVPDTAVSGKRIDIKKLRDILLPLLILAAGAGLVLYYIIGPAEGYMTSDCTDSLRWSYATYESGRLVSDSFYYAALLPFGGNLIFLPFIAMFGYSMAAQICGLTFFALLLIAALYYMARGLGFGRCMSAGMTSTVMLIMSSSTKLREIMWEHIFYYNLGILFFCFGFGLAFRILREGGVTDGLSGRKPLDWVRCGVIVIFSLIAATDGLQTLVCFTLPLLFGIFAERFFDAEEALISKRNLITVGFLGAVAVASALGFLLIGTISHGVSAGYAEAYSTYSAMSTWSTNFIGFFSNWFSLLGVSVESGDPLVSLASIVNMIGIFGGLLLLILPFVLLFRYNKIGSRQVKMLLIGHFALSAFIMFAWTFGKLGGANWRLTPMLGTSVIVSFVSAAELIKQKKAAARIGALLLGFIIIMACVPALQILRMPADYGDENSWHVAAAQLEERGLKYGYANFWWAEAITMFSDGEVQVVNLYPDQTTPQKYCYQIPHNAYDDKDTDRYFLLLTESENVKMTAWLAYQRASGAVSEEFIIESEPYNLRGYSGTQLYIYVFSENIF